MPPGSHTMRPLQNNYTIYIRLYLFNKIKWLSIKINNKKIKKFEKGKLLKWLDKKVGMRIEEEIRHIGTLILKERKKIFSKQAWEYVKGLNIKISKLKMSLDIGTGNAIITSYLTAFAGTVISILLAFAIENYKKENYSYKITPLYKNQNLLKMDLNCIINIKMVHIMNIIVQGILFRCRRASVLKNVPLKRRSERKHDGTSNRRTYDHSYEQY